MVTIREISEKKDIKQFVRFTNNLYKDNPYFVPDMFDSQVSDFDRSKNPAYAYCDTKCFLAYKNGQIVGRIAAIYNTQANQKYKLNQMRFSHVDFIDDDEVVDALFAAVECWAKEKQCVSIHGPLGFSDMDREGLLIDGFDQLSMFITYYNHPYYKTQLERMGYTKSVDWLEYKVLLGDENDERMVKLARLSAVVKKRAKLTVASLKRKKEIRPYVQRVFALYNEVYAALYGTSVLTDAQVEHYVDEFLPLIDERTTAIICDENNDVIAFGVAAPTIAKAMQACGGKMLPFGWYHILKALKGKNDTLDMFLIAIHPDYQGKGVNAIIMNHLIQYARKNGVKYAETGPELETNTEVQAQWRFFDTVQHKRRRCFIKELSEKE